MSEGLVLEHLRAIEADIADMKAELRELKCRVTAMGTAFAAFIATEASHYASLASRADRTDDRLERIESYLDLTRVPQNNPDDRKVRPRPS